MRKLIASRMRAGAKARRLPDSVADWDMPGVRGILRRVRSNLQGVESKSLFFRAEARTIRPAISNAAINGHSSTVVHESAMAHAKRMSPRPGLGPTP